MPQSSTAGPPSPPTDAIEVVISKLQEIVKDPSSKSTSTSSSPTMENQTEANKTIVVEPQHEAAKLVPLPENDKEMIVQIPGIKGQVLAQSTEKLIDALQKINTALGKVNAKTPISEAKAVKNVTGENVYRCNQCEYWSHNKYYWKQHVDLVHNAERVYKCPFCDYAGKRSHSLKEHLVVHSNYRPYECGLCNASFRKKGHLTNHVRMHSQSRRAEEEENKCATCNVVFANGPALFGHLRSLHKNEKTTYLCEFCQYATMNKANIVMHMQAHGNPKTLCCNVCGFQTCHHNILLEHFVSTHPKCNIVYTTIQSKVAQPVILMKCTECGFTAGSNDALRQHMYTHLDESDQNQSSVQATPEPSKAPVPPIAAPAPAPAPAPAKQSQFAYKCSQCSYTCSEAYTFITHMVSHKDKDKETQQAAAAGSSEKPKLPHIPGAKVIPPTDDPSSQGWYQCTICGYLGQQRTIKAHIWKHSGHKDVSYPMFQNGPISIYDETPIGVKKLKNDSHMIRARTENVEESQQGEQRTGNTQTVCVEKYIMVQPEVAQTVTTVEASLDVQQPVVEEPVVEDTQEGKEVEEDDEDEGPLKIKEDPGAKEVLEGVQENGYTLIEVVGIEDADIATVELSETADSARGIKRKADDPEYQSTEKVVKFNEVEIETCSVDNSVPVPNSQDVGLEIEICSEESNLEETAVDESAEIMKALNSTHRSHEEILALLALLQSNQEKDEDDKEEQPKKPGICTSLLTVIEQLRERSKSISGDEVEEKEEEAEEADEDDDDEESSSEDSNQPEPLPRLEDVEQLHKNIERIQGGFRCRLCHYFSLAAGNMNTHMRLHKLKAPHECSLCDFEAGSSGELQKHMLIHCKVRTFQCKQCRAVFHYKGGLKAHLKKHSSEEQQQQQQQQEVVEGVRCDKCCEVFASEEKLNKHQDVCCREPQLCPICKHRIGRRRPHRCRKLYRCETCGVLCPNIAALRLHVKQQHAAVTEESLQCELCDFLATSQRSLKSHMKRHRNDQRFVEQPLEQYKCNLCGYVCHHLPSLKSHMWRHASDRNYSYEQTNHVINRALDNGVAKGVSVITFRCCQCGFESLDKVELNKHMASHNDIIQRTLEVNRGRILGKMVEKLQGGGGGGDAKAGREIASNASEGR